MWHRKHLRVEDQLVLSRAVADGDAVCPLFVFDPTFYEDGGLACNARIRLLEEAVASLDRLYAAASLGAVYRERDGLDGAAHRHAGLLDVHDRSGW